MSSPRKAEAFRVPVPPPAVTTTVAPTNDYEKLLNSIYCVTDGSVDITAFEDECRMLLGTNSYLVFTIDKLLTHLCKQLHTFVTDQVAHQSAALLKNEAKRGAQAQKSREAAILYRDNALAMLHEHGVDVRMRSGVELLIATANLPQH